MTIYNKTSFAEITEREARALSGCSLLYYEPGYSARGENLFLRLNAPVLSGDCFADVSVDREGDIYKVEVRYSLRDRNLKYEGARKDISFNLQQRSPSHFLSKLCSRISEQVLYTDREYLSAYREAQGARLDPIEAPDEGSLFSRVKSLFIGEKPRNPNTNIPIWEASMLRTAGSGLRVIHRQFPSLTLGEDKRARAILNALLEAVIQPTRTTLVGSSPVKGLLSVGGMEHEYEGGFRNPYASSHKNLVKGNAGGEAVSRISADDLAKEIARSLRVSEGEVIQSLFGLEQPAPLDLLNALSRGVEGRVAFMPVGVRVDFLNEYADMDKYLDLRAELEGLEDSLEYEIKVMGLTPSNFGGLTFLVSCKAAYSEPIPLTPEDEY